MTPTDMFSNTSSWVYVGSGAGQSVWRLPSPCVSSKGGADGSLGVVCTNATIHLDAKTSVPVYMHTVYKETGPHMTSTGTVAVNFSNVQVRVHRPLSAALL